MENGEKSRNEENRKIEKCVQWQMENALLKSLALIAFALLTTNLRLATARGLRDDPARWRERERKYERESEGGRQGAGVNRKWVKPAINSSATKTV